MDESFTDLVARALSLRDIILKSIAIPAVKLKIKVILTLSSSIEDWFYKQTY